MIMMLRWLSIVLCFITGSATIAFSVLGMPKQHVEWAGLCSIISMNGAVIAMYLDAIYEKLNSNKP